MVHRIAVCSFVACLLAALAPAGAAEFVAPLSPRAPVLDGRLDPQEWASAVSVDGFSRDGTLERRRVRAFVTATETHLYVAVQSQLPAEGDLLAAVQQGTEKLAFDDSAEVWVDPTPGSESGAAYQLLGNAAGKRFFSAHPRGGARVSPAWAAGWKLASSRQAGWWTWEVAIPVASIAPGRKASDGAWGINLCRDWKQPGSFTSLGGGAYAPGKDVLFRFQEGAPAVAHEFRADPLSGVTNSVLLLRNPGRQSLSLKVRQHLQRDTMPDSAADQTVTLAAGRSAEVPLVVANEGAFRSAKLQLDVAPAAGGPAYYHRDLAWKVGPAQYAWKAVRSEKPPIDLQFAYYPYLEKMRVLADVSGLPAGARLEGVDITVRPRGGGKAVKTVRLTQFDANGRGQTTFALPGLDGQYDLAARAVGQGVPPGEVVKPFDRRHYPWEHNTLGKSQTVYPPFEPLRLAGGTLHAVLRDYRLNGLGLWDQVTATSAQTNVSKPILAAPMRYVAGTPAGEAPVIPTPARVVAQSPSQVVVQGGFDAGAARGTALCTWSVDGMMRVDLTLAPGDGRELRSLTLEIPIRDDAAPLMHAMTDGIRSYIATSPVPAGEGVVWDAGKLPAQDLPKGFCTYLFLGGPVRGLAWFAENDRGWSWNPATPNLDLVRRGGVLTLRVHLVNKPLVVTAPRTLTFGLQAAPIKPRLSPWRWRYYRDRYSLLGTDINWFALGYCGSVYPAGKDMSLWEALRRGNREHLTDAEVNQVFEHGKKYFEPYGADAVENFRRHVWHNLKNRFGTKMVFYYNRASYQDADEFQTFEDEWALTDHRTVGPGRDINEIKIVPSESYIDHALYWYGKSFDIAGNQGVYWDNWFFVGSFNTQMTPAYARPDGSIMPATGLFELRELPHRTFQYMNERKMVPITMAHMTSTSILPMLGFATVQYDWEWMYSQGDVQDRFSRDYILLISNGELAGTWPVLLGDHGAQEQDPWIQRTYAAVSIVHELDPAPVNSKAWEPLLKPIQALLDDPKLQVYRYWDERPQPVSANNPDLPAIVYSVPGKEAVAAVTSYAHQDTDTVLTIDPNALGFAGAYKVINAETGEAMPVQADRVSFRLKKHDIREIRIVPDGA